MRDAVIVFLVLSVGGLGYGFYEQSIVLKAQQTQLAAQTARIQTNNGRASLDEQSKCAKQALEDFKHDGYEGEALATFTDHYNEKMGKCFVVYQVNHFEKKYSSESKIIFDAFELKEYGEFNWMKNERGIETLSKGLVTLPDGQVKESISSDEFDQSAKVFME